MIEKTGSRWRIVRRVPKRFSGIETRKKIKIALKTDSETEARRRAPIVWEKQLTAWEAQLAGDTARAELMFADARNEAQRMGIPYIAANDVSKSDLQGIAGRITAASKGAPQADAALGFVDVPDMPLDDVLGLFWKLSSDKISKKTTDQIRRWKNPRKKAFKIFQSVTDVTTLQDISREKMLDFREYLVERVNRGEIIASSANKDLVHFCGPIRFVNRLKGWNLDLPFSDLTLEVGRKAKRGTFSTEWIKTKILADGALDGLPPEAQDIVFIMVNTGARPSEIAGAHVHHFELNGNIPLMWIVDEGRQLKNDNSLRSIPLAGVSLDAARRAVDRARKGGEADQKAPVQVFPRYFGKDRLSDDVNRHFRLHGLKEKDNTTLYSLRHSMEDRLKVARVDVEVRKDLFGHAKQREEYGEGGGDLLRYQAIKAIAL